MTKFFQCSNCLSFFTADNLIITEYYAIDLKKMYLLVCEDCLRSLEEGGILDRKKELNQEIEQLR